MSLRYSRAAHCSSTGEHEAVSKMHQSAVKEVVGRDEFKDKLQTTKLRRRHRVDTTKTDQSKSYHDQTSIDKAKSANRSGFINKKTAADAEASGAKRRVSHGYDVETKVPRPSRKQTDSNADFSARFNPWSDDHYKTKDKFDQSVRKEIANKLNTTHKHLAQHVQIPTQGKVKATSVKESVVVEAFRGFKSQMWDK